MRPDRIGERAPAELAFSPRLREGERFSHFSAARLWGIPLPPDADPRVHTVAGEALDRRCLPDVVGHRRSGATALLRGIALSTPLETYVELARSLKHEDLVAVGDWLVHSPRFDDPLGVRPFETVASLQSKLERARAWGIVRARRAATFVREGVESRQETRLRLLLQEAGFPTPTCGALVRDQRGAPIGYFDLVWPEHRVIVEYDGDQHRTDPAQYEKDIMRFDRATAADWRVVRTRARGLRHEGRPETIGRVRDAFGAFAKSVSRGP